MHEPKDEQVLRERAAALARAGRNGVGAPTRRALTFMRRGRRYAVDAQACSGVQAIAELLELGDVPAPFVGYTVFRGEPLALFDPDGVFGRTEEGSQSTSSQGEARLHAVVLGGDRPRLGLLADTVDQVAELELSLFEGQSHPDPLLLGTGPRVQVLDAERLVRDPRFLVDQSE